MCLELQARMPDLMGTFGIGQQVDDGIGGGLQREVAPFEQHRAHTRGQETSASLAHGLGRIDGLRQQQGGLRQVGGDHGSQGQQAQAHRVEGVRLQQPRTGRRHHHRVQHEVAGAVVLQGIGNRMDHVRRGQHAQFHRLHVEIVKAGVDLRAQKRKRRHFDRGDAAGVLGRQRGNRTQPVHAMGGKGLQVGLDARAAAGIGAGDGQGTGRARIGHANSPVGHGAMMPGSSTLIRSTRQSRGGSWEQA